MASHAAPTAQSPPIPAGLSREQLLERLCTEKMGMPALAWKSPDAKLQTFTALILGPEPF